MAYPIPVDLTDKIFNPHPYSVDDPRQQEIDTALLDGKDDLISAKFIVDYLGMQIKKELEKNWRNYNTDRIPIDLKPFPESAFKYLFDRAIKARLNKKKEIEEIYSSSTISFKVEPMDLSYLFGKGWWSIDTYCDSTSNVQNGKFACHRPVQITYNKKRFKLRIGLSCINVNLRGVAQ